MTYRCTDEDRFQKPDDIELEEHYTIDHPLISEEYETEDEAEVAAKEACHAHYLNSVSVIKHVQRQESESVSEWYWDEDENMVKGA